MKLMKRILTRIEELSTPRNLAYAIITSFVVVSIMGYGIQTFVYDVYGDADMPDTMFAYDITHITEAFQKLGPDGLRIWLTVHLLDFIFSIAYSLALAFGIMMELNALEVEKKQAKLLSLIPLFAGLFDYIENIIIAHQAIAYPVLTPMAISIASAITSTKWLLLYSAFSIVFILILVVIYNRLSGDKSLNTKSTEVIS